MGSPARISSAALLRWVGVYLKGVCMGAADMIPGVSGGTIALIVGIYDRLVNAIAAFDPRSVGYLVRIYDVDARAALSEDIRAMDIPFLLALGAGIGTAVIVLSRIILFVFHAFPALVNAFFFGLIGGSALLIYRDVEIDSPSRGAVAVVGFLLAFMISGIAAGGGPASLTFVFLAGAIAISAMILPGISGAAILYILGQYEYMLDALRTTTDASRTLLAGTASPEAIESGVVVVTFICGATLGLLTTAKIVSWALSQYRVGTLVFLVSLMVGALRLPIEEIYGVTGVPGVRETLTLATVGLIGILAVYALDRATGSLTYT